MRHVEIDRRRLGVRKGHAHLGDIVATKDLERGFGAHGPAATLAFPIEESPHVGQERDELAVVPCLELFGRAVEVVARLAPGMRPFRLLEQIPGLLDLRPFANRHELQRPEQDLPEVTNELGHGLAAMAT